MSLRETRFHSDKPSAAIWTEESLAAPHTAVDKARRVQGMFNAIARSYERINRLFSFGRDATWRRDTVRLAKVTATDVVLDVACGTGDMARAVRRAGAWLVVGCDFAHEMLKLAVGRERDAHESAAKHDAGGTTGARMDTGASEDRSAGSSMRRQGGGAMTTFVLLDNAIPPGAGIQFCEADGLNLPFRDGAFTAVFCAFGVRNFQDMDRGLREFYRVLAPGGRAAILEFSRPHNPLIRAVSDVYCGWIMPRLATFLSRDRSGAYHYLPRSVTSFADASELTARLTAAGFARVEAVTRTFGVVTIYVAWR